MHYTFSVRSAITRRTWGPFRQCAALCMSATCMSAWYCMRYHTALQTSSDICICRASASVRKCPDPCKIHGDCWTTADLRQKVCNGPHYAFCGLQFAKPCSAARVVNMAILYMHSNSPDTRGIWISGYSALVDDISCYPYVKKSTVNMTNWWKISS